MLRLMMECADCGYQDEEVDIDDDWALVGQCPRCGDHHGNVMYFTEMKIGEFVEELAKMDEKDIAKRALAIKYIAEGIVDNGDTK